MTGLRETTVLVLGGAGQVGFEICKKILEEKPHKLVICDLKKEQVEKAAKELRANNRGVKIETSWGNIFVSENIKDKTSQEILEQKETELQVLNDVFSELSEDILEKSTLYKIIQKIRPEIVIDAINTATALAYQDPYAQVLKEDEEKWMKIALSMSIPQLVRHTQILFHALKRAKTKLYIKIGTSGTGGLGFTLPYTHGENEVPSRLLMSKSAVAGAQTMLLWVLARTPGAPEVKEIKVTALIGWRQMGEGKIITKGGPIELYDCKVEEAQPVSKALEQGKYTKTGKQLEGAWIDTGENDLFTKDMFAAITTADGMALITPEEIAETTIQEIVYGNSDREIIESMDRAVLGPTIRGIAKRKIALDKLSKLNGDDTGSIKTLGPLTSKIIWEATILKKVLNSKMQFSNLEPKKIAELALEVIKTNTSVRAKIISVGMPILLPNGKLLRGPEICIPATKQAHSTINDFERWAEKGWVDLRASNWRRWITRLENYLKDTNGNTSKEFRIGEVCGWVFAHELGGLRLKK